MTGFALRKRIPYGDGDDLQKDYLPGARGFLPVMPLFYGKIFLKSRGGLGR
jgi:hypothetical protein